MIRAPCTLFLESGCYPKEPVLEPVFVHPTAIVPNHDTAAPSITEVDSRDDDMRRVGVVAVLNECQKSSRVSANKQLTEFTKDVSIDRKEGRIVEHGSR